MMKKLSKYQMKVIEMLKEGYDLDFYTPDQSFYLSKDLTLYGVRPSTVEVLVKEGIISAQGFKHGELIGGIYKLVN